MAQKLPNRWEPNTDIVIKTLRFSFFSERSSPRPALFQSDAGIDVLQLTGLRPGLGIRGEPSRIWKPGAKPLPPPPRHKRGRYFFSPLPL